MSITINELTITVAGNVVKNNTEDGKGSILRVTQAQAQSLYDQLGPVLDFFKAQAGPDASGSVLDATKTVAAIKAVGAGTPAFQEPPTK